MHGSVNDVDSHDAGAVMEEDEYLVLQGCWWEVEEQEGVHRMWLGGGSGEVVWQSRRTALYRAATLLVAASPCAIVISVPAAILSALSAAARGGV